MNMGGGVQRPLKLTTMGCMDAGTEETVGRKTVGRKTLGRKTLERKTLGRQTLDGRTEPHLLEYLIYDFYFLS